MHPPLDNLEDFFIFPFALVDRFPEITVPLLPGDGETPLDLQAVFERTYRAGPYSREIDYAADRPEPPLSQQQQAWAAERLAAT